MKARESGMPDEKMWQEFFDIDRILNELEINKNVENLIELGFGYGTFTITAAKIIKGNLYAYDIEEDLFTGLESKIKSYSLNNIVPVRKDFISEGTGLKDGEADYVMLFNILHAEESASILNESYRILQDKGKVGVIHWNYDPQTPRGPSMSIRPKPEDLKHLLVHAGFSIVKFNVNLPPYHYGILAEK